MAAPLVLWQKPGPTLRYRHEVMREFHAGFEMEYYRSGRSAAGFARAAWLKAIKMWLFFLGPVLTAPLFALPWLFRDRRTRTLWLIGGLFVLAAVFEVFLFPHYVAPITGLIYVVVVQGLRHLRQWKVEGRPAGLFLVRAIPVLCVLLLVARALAMPLGLSVVTPTDAMTWYSAGPAMPERQAVLSHLQKLGGQHLVIVRYGPNHNVHRECVYNAADIDGEKVVWAREMDAASNAALIRYFHRRHIWLFEPDRSPLLLYPCGSWCRPHSRR